MWWLRFARTVSRNPKILVPVVALIVAAVIMDLTLFSSPTNPLPDENEVLRVEVSRDPNAAERSFVPLEMEDYLEIAGCLQACEESEGVPPGKATATLLVHKRDGGVVRAVFHEGGVLRVNETVYENAAADRLARIFARVAPPPQRW